MKIILLKVILIMSLFYIFGCATTKDATQESKWTEWRTTYDQNCNLTQIQYSLCQSTFG